MGDMRSMKSLSRRIRLLATYSLICFVAGGCATPTSSTNVEKKLPPQITLPASTSQSSAPMVQSSLDAPNASQEKAATIIPTQARFPDPAKPEVKAETKDPSLTAQSIATIPGKLNLEDVVFRTLTENPQLAAFRQQRQVAEAGIVIAKTYPFNPLWQSYVWSVNGPKSADVKNPVFNEHTMRLDLEVRGQGTHRRNAADAALTRTDWEIATQEIAVSILTIRSFWTQLYREEKLKVLDDTIRLNEETVKQVKRLVDAGRAKSADLVLIRTEVDVARATRGQGNSALAVAKADLRRNLGSLDQDVAIRGSLEVAIPEISDEPFEAVALRTRPDLQARKMAVNEAEALLKLEIANRYGNPSIGPAFELDDTRTYYAGMWLVTPIPVFNTRRGEIQQREAARRRALLDVRQIEIQTQQDVQAALSRLAEARKWVRVYQDDVLPNLKKGREDLEKLFNQGDPSVDVLRVIDVQRKLLAAYDRFLDARFEVLQALADLAAAIGDPSIAMGLRLKKDETPKNPGAPVRP